MTLSRTALVVNLICLVAAFPAAANPGDLDTNFGIGGKVLVHFTPYTDERSHGVLIQSNGLILLGGESNYGDAVASFLPDGTLNTGFASGGKLFQSTHGFPDAMALVDDDKFIMAGASWLGGITTEYFYVRRYTRVGAPDLSFGTNGAVSVNMSNSTFAFVSDTKIQPDGKIVLVGPVQTGTNQYFGVVRCNPDGSLDATGFGTAGRIFTGFGREWNRPGGVALQSDGKILVAGYSENGADDAAFALARYTTNGLLDPTFNGNGKVTSSFGVGSEAFSVAVQDDGKIVLGGWANFQLALARYTPDGALDTSFGQGGLVTNHVGSWDSWQKIALQPDGKILAAGHTATTGHLIVGRYLPDGQPDPGFGVDGFVLTTLGTQSSEASAMALQKDGKLLVAGTAWNGENTYSDFALARFQNDAVALPGISCPPPVEVDCQQPAELTAVVHNASGLPLTVLWEVNGQVVQTNNLPATNAPSDVPVSYSALLPLGTNSVTVSVSDEFAHQDSCTTTVVVADLSPPVIVSAEVTPTVLWPPNHRLVPVTITAVVTDGCDTADWRIASVRSNEPSLDRHEPDWLITGPHTLLLRAERLGAGGGRIYTITLQASDTSGHVSATRELSVTVPNNAKRPRARSIE